MSPKKRLDNILVEKNLAQSLDQAQKFIISGLVSVNGALADKAGSMHDPDSQFSLKDRKEYVGRGAYKLISALDKFEISLAGKTCSDIGSSTGGFTEVMLERGAVKVFAVDVGYGELDYKLRKDPRVAVMERTNARYLESFPQEVSFSTVDVSFISVKQILPALSKCLTSNGEMLVLVKPQFEADKSEVGEGGIITDPAVHIKVLESVMKWTLENTLFIRGLMKSGLEGTKGNKEFFLWLSKVECENISVDSLIKSSVA